MKTIENEKTIVPALRNIREGWGILVGKDASNIGPYHSSYNVAD